MAVAEQEDRLDRNDRNISDTGARVTDKIAALSVQIAVVTTKMEGLTSTLEKRLDNVENAIRESTSRYATKEDMKDLDIEVEKLKTAISWGVKIIIGAFLLALVAIVFRNGVPGK